METLVKFFNDYHELRTNYHFRPDCIYNLDETMINLCPTRKKVIVFSDQPKPAIFESGKLEHITLLFCVTASGRFMKPLAILPRLTHMEYPSDIEADYDITGNDSGWITGQIFKNWIEIQFVAEVLQVRSITGSEDPVLVLLDNHSSRSSIDLEFMWNQYKICFLFLPPHTSHLIQPLDKTPNYMFKRLLTDNFVGDLNETSHERRINVLRTAKNCIYTALSPLYNLKGWKHAGLEPYDPERILLSGLVQHPKLETHENVENAPKKKRVKYDSRIMSNGFFPYPGIKAVEEV